MSAPAEASDQPARATAQRSLFHRPSAWLMAAAFGTHTFMFYGLTAWLPVYLTSTIGASANTAGFAASLFQIMGLTGCFGIPRMANRLKDSHMVLFLAVTIAWFAMAVGTYLAPSLWPVWAIFGGFGSSGGYVVIFDLMMSRAATLNEGRKMSTFVQGLGYVVASISPTVVGSLHQWTASWRSAASSPLCARRSAATTSSRQKNALTGEGQGRSDPTRFWGDTCFRGTEFRNRQPCRLSRTGGSFP